MESALVVMVQCKGTNFPNAPFAALALAHFPTTLSGNLASDSGPRPGAVPANPIAVCPQPLWLLLLIDGITTFDRQTHPRPDIK